MFSDLATVRVCCQELIEDLRCDRQRACYITQKPGWLILLHTLSSPFILLFYVVKGKLLAQVLAEMCTFELEKLLCA